MLVCEDKSKHTLVLLIRYALRFIHYFMINEYILSNKLVVFIVEFLK